MARLQPNKTVMNPNVNVPAIPPSPKCKSRMKLMELFLFLEPFSLPIAFIEPIQESCSLVKGPLSSGVSFDISSGVAGAIHPKEF